MTNSQKKRVKKWIAALRGWKYMQGKGALRSLDDKFCCLGVACDLVARQDWEKYCRNYYMHFVNNRLPIQIMGIYGLRDSFGGNSNKSLSDMNDRGATFSEIANFIEEEMNNPDSTLFV